MGLKHTQLYLMLGTHPPCPHTGGSAGPWVRTSTRTRAVCCFQPALRVPSSLAHLSWPFADPFEICFTTAAHWLFTGTGLHCTPLPPSGGLLASVPSIVVVASIGVALEVEDPDQVRLAMMASPSSGFAITLCEPHSHTATPFPASPLTVSNPHPGQALSPVGLLPSLIIHVTPRSLTPMLYPPRCHHPFGIHPPTRLGRGVVYNADILTAWVWLPAKLP